MSIKEKFKMRTFNVVLKKDDLVHHGILGQKWGVRRYQNKDGSLTAAGKRRLGYGRNRTHQQAASDYRNVSSIADQAARASRSGQNLMNQSAERARQKARNSIDPSSMTDKDLQAAVNRLNLERQYKTLSAESIGDGKRYLGSLLQTAGDALTVASSAAAILVAIHELKKK